MFRLTIKELAARKLRLVATALAVIIGVAFLAGTLTLTATVTGTFDDLLAKADAGTDAYVRGDSPLDLGLGSSRPRVDTGLVDTLRAVDDVAAVAVRVSGYAQILDKHGKAVGDPQTGVLGMNWTTVSELNPFRLTAGHAPAGPDEIVIDKSSADKTGYTPGDHTTVLTGGTPRPATIVGVAKFGTADSPGGTAMVLFDDATAQAMLAEPGFVDGIAVVAAANVTQQALVTNLASVIDDRSEVITGAQLTTEDQNQRHDEIEEQPRRGLPRFRIHGIPALQRIFRAGRRDCRRGNATRPKSLAAELFRCRQEADNHAPNPGRSDRIAIALHLIRNGCARLASSQSRHRRNAG